MDNNNIVNEVENDKFLTKAEITKKHKKER